MNNQEYRLRYVGKLPLHLLIVCNDFSSGGVSENADCFRYLLKRFPMAALLVDRSYPINAPYQSTLLTHPINTYQSAVLTHPLSPLLVPYQPTLPTHLKLY